jgi:hypothetical protein
MTEVQEPSGASGVGVGDVAAAASIGNCQQVPQRGARTPPAWSTA